MGGVPTYIGASAEIKLTLGPRVVYIVDVWVANFRKGVDVLIGISFMFAAGLRIRLSSGSTVDLRTRNLLYAARSWPVVVRVVNISDKNTWVNQFSDVARIVEYGFFSRHDRFVRPGSAAYRDWEVLILENTASPETKKRLKLEADLEDLIPQPPCADHPVYPWPTKILQRPRFDNARVQFVKSPPAPRVKRVRFALDVSMQTEDLPGKM
ncbi:hypothetical protein V7S43_016657 [Phytophthora oleae]|uniref:Aspartic protease n=1 Tax=Phytophthora oleae TaxID=2107226 RepID=A0ABD3EUY8_9STRA